MYQVYNDVWGKVECQVRDQVHIKIPMTLYNQVWRQLWGSNARHISRQVFYTLNELDETSLSFNSESH